MIWIPVFLFASHLVLNRLLEIWIFVRVPVDQNLVCDMGTGFNESLNEVCRLKQGYPTDSIRAAAILLAAAILVLSAMSLYFVNPKQLGAFSFYGVEIGIGIGIAYQMFLVAGVNPLQTGYILIDKETLRIPKFFSTYKFTRSKTTVWIYRAGNNFSTCVVRAPQKQAYFFLDASSSETLRSWTNTAEP